jgi:hypothetical protein
MGRLRLHRTVLRAALLCAVAVQGCAADAVDTDEPCRTITYSDVSVYAHELAAGRVGPPGLPFDTILKYADAVITGQGPSNSMARLDFQREYYPDLDDDAAEAAIERARDRDVACHREVVETAYGNILRLPADNTWRAIEVLMSQDQDSHLVGIVSELALRLDPARFEELTQALAKRRPANAAIFDYVREHGRWNRGGF